MPKVREPNFDFLRIISTIAVVMLHVSAKYLHFDSSGMLINETPFPIMLLNHLVRFAVPCFFMLSGAFILEDDRNADIKYFYNKSFKNIGITSVFFCLLYVLYSITKLLAGVFILKMHDIDHIIPRLLEILKNFMKGQPYYHLWYLFTLIGLYLATPFIIRLAADLRGGVNLYGKPTTVLLVLASVSSITSEHLLVWDVGAVFCFMSYFLMGYKLRQWGKTRKNNRIALLLITSGIAINVILAYINYLRGLKGLPIDVIQYYRNPFSYAPLAPIEVIASCLIFAGFSVMDIKKDFSKLAGYTFLIYLIHAGVWDVISTVLGDILIGNWIVETLSVIMITMAVFLLSFLGAMLYRKLSPFERMLQK